jgi:hypothetical protein
MSEANGNSRRPEPPERTASLRAEVLKSEIGKAYSRNPRERLEHRMDRPVNGRPGKSIFKVAERIEATIERYSWCWPICMRYPVLTLGVLGISAEEARQEGLRLGDDEGEDTFILDDSGEAKPLTQTHVARILGLKAPNVSAAYSLMVARKTLQVDGKKVNLVADPPQLTPEEREKVIDLDNFFATLDLPEGAKLPPEDLKLLASIPEKVIRLDIFSQLQVIQTDYEKARKVLQTDRDQRRKVIHEKARNLIVNQSIQRDQNVPSSSSAGNATETTTTQTSDPVLDATRDYATVDDPGLDALKRACRKAAPNCNPTEMAYAVHVKGLLAAGKNNPFGFLLTAVPAYLASNLRDIRERLAAARPKPVRSVQEDTTEEKIRHLTDRLDRAREIANDTKYPQAERDQQRERVREFTEQLAALNGNGLRYEAAERALK